MAVLCGLSGRTAAVRLCDAGAGDDLTGAEAKEKQNVDGQLEGEQKPM